MNLFTHLGRVALLLSMIVLLLPETLLAQRAEVVSIQSRRGKITFPHLKAPFRTSQQIDEIEPNNTLEEVQVIEEASPAVINGMIEVADEGDLIVEFTDGSSDDLEDLFGIVTTEDGLNIVLDGFDDSDLDLWVIGEDEMGEPVIIEGSLNDSPEVLDLPTLEAGTYVVAVAIYDPAPGAQEDTYTLTITGSISTDIADEAEVPTRFALGQNYPNPFNPETRIQYEVPTNTAVRLEVFNLLGRKVRTLVNEGQAAGVYSVTWNGTTDAGTSVATGVYVYRLQAGSFSQTRTMVLLQ